MKVNELGEIPGEFICDFCGIGWDLLWSVNDGLWAVCSKCMDLHFGSLAPKAGQSAKTLSPIGGEEE